MERGALHAIVHGVTVRHDLANQQQQNKDKTYAIY